MTAFYYVRLCLTPAWPPLPDICEICSAYRDLSTAWRYDNFLFHNNLWVMCYKLLTRSNGLLSCSTISTNDMASFQHLTCKPYASLSWAVLELSMSRTAQALHHTCSSLDLPIWRVWVLVDSQSPASPACAWILLVNCCQWGWPSVVTLKQQSSLSLIQCILLDLPLTAKLCPAHVLAPILHKMKPYAELITYLGLEWEISLHRD